MMLSHFLHLPQTLAEKNISRFAATCREKLDLPLCLELWNHKRFQFSLRPPTVLLRLTSPRAARHLRHPSLATLGRAYVEGDLDIDGPIDEVVRLVTRLAETGRAMRSHVARLRHTRSLDAASIAHHYDVSNDFYRLWLDEAMVYSCAYFHTANDTLEQAQTQKIDHILRKIRLLPGHRLLDIGCGWGALVIRAAREFGARCVGITLSKEQYALARQRVKDEGLENCIEIRLQDYRDVEGAFDRITSVGMFEHVGLANLQSYFRRIHDLLTDDGIAMNHGITSSHPDSAGTPLGAGDFIERYVFPNGELPHIGLTLQEMSAAGLEASDVENLRLHYAMTLRHWSQRFETHAGKLREIAGEKRFRIWRAYLAGCAHAFDANWIALHQIVACKPGRMGEHPLPMTRDYIYAKD